MKTETEKMLEFIAISKVMAKYLDQVVRDNEMTIYDAVDILDVFRKKEAEIELAVASLEKGMIKYN